MDCDRAQKLIQLYTERKLDGEELEDFLSHIEHCENCQEELEVSYMIYYALKQLDSDDDCFDMKHLMKDDIHRAKEYLQQQEDRKFVEKMIRFAIVICSLILIGVWIESIRYGGIENTKVVKYLREETYVLETEALSEDKIGAQETEAETNHKKEIILKTPETEAHTEPGLIPDM